LYYYDIMLFLCYLSLPSLSSSVANRRFLNSGMQFDEFLNVSTAYTYSELIWNIMSSEKQNANSKRPADFTGQMASGLAHEFNNLFTTIGGSAEIALLEIGSRHRISQDLEIIRQASTRGAEMIAQLLYASGTQLVHREKLGSLGWHRILNKISRTAPDTVTCRVDVPHDVWPVYIDRHQLSAMLKQLIDNAISAMSGNGCMTLLLDNVQYDGRGVQHAGPYLRLQIEDSGPGLDASTKERLFEPFFTTNPGSAHSGLGLAMVQGIVRRHGGWIDVNSLPGEGTRISVYWPAQPDWKQHQRDRGWCDSMAPGRRVLVVEDEEDVREFTMMGLSQDGFDVAGAGSAEEAESLFDHESFHVVVSDVGLPDGNGVELIERLVLQKPELKVLLSSGYSDHQHRWPAIRERGYPFLEKPYALQDLIDTVRQMNA